jgi:hemerythrin
MFEFTEDCLIGIEEIDNEHRHLFELINRGMELLEYHGEGDSYDEIRALIAELENYAEVHFEHEEKYMEEIKDPGLVSQRIQHGIFKSRVCNWTFADKDTSQEQRELLEEMMNYMVKWLYNHIIGSDMMIGKMAPVEEWRLKEQPCEFTDAYLTGLDFIDNEHKELFRIIKQADELVRLGVIESDLEEIRGILDELESYTKSHFSNEERYMRSIKYDGLDAQKRAHAAFVERLEMLDYDKMKESPQETMEHLIEFLTKWLINHIMHMDKKIPKNS